MLRTIFMALTLAVVFAVSAPVWAQADASTNPEGETQAADTDTSGGADAEEPGAVTAEDDAPVAEEDAAAGDDVEVVEGAREKIEDFAADVDQSDEAKKISAGILNPIYTLAEKLSFPYFHWLAFAAMVAGVISFALQLVLGKLIVLSRMSLSPSEILADSLGLVISLVGLVLTTQAAAENSTFTTSSFAVISSAAVGVLAGFIFYVWGQRQELLAVEGRRRVAAAEKIAAANKK